MKYCPTRNVKHTHFVSEKKLENSKFWTFLNFPPALYCNAHKKKYITIHMFWVNFRPSFRHYQIQILRSFQGLLPLDPHQPTGELIAPPGSQLYCTMTCGHSMSCLRHDTRSRPKSKKASTTWGVIDQAASPAASLSPRH